MQAYGGRCAVSGLPESRLLDAAHIVDLQNVNGGGTRNDPCPPGFSPEFYDIRS